MKSIDLRTHGASACGVCQVFDGWDSVEKYLKSKYGEDVDIKREDKS